MQTIKPASKTTAQSEVRRDTPNCPVAIGDPFEGPFIVFSPVLFNFLRLSPGGTLRIIARIVTLFMDSFKNYAKSSVGAHPETAMWEIISPEADYVRSFPTWAVAERVDLPHEVPDRSKKVVA